MSSVGIESNKVKNLRHDGDQEVMASQESNKDGDRRVSQSTGTSTLGKFNLAQKAQQKNIVEDVYNKDRVETNKSEPADQKEEKEGNEGKKEDPNNSKVEESDLDKTQEKPGWHKTLAYLLDHWVTSTIMTIVTIYALFSDDVKMLFFTKSVDELFDIMTIIALILFTFEIIVSSIVKDDYTCGFYFWLDFISTLSLVMDIGFVMNKITGAEDFSASNAQQATQLAKAGRGARVGTKAGRITRVVRLVRLIRIVKLYKNTKQALDRHDQDEITNLEAQQMEQENINKYGAEGQNEEEQEKSESDEEEEEQALEDVTKSVQDDEQIDIPEESMVGKKLSDLTTRRVIIVVLTMLISTSVINVSTWLEIPDSLQFGLDLLQQYEKGTDSFNRVFDSFIT